MFFKEQIGVNCHLQKPKKEKNACLLSLFSFYLIIKTQSTLKVSKKAFFGNYFLDMFLTRLAIRQGWS